MLSSRFLVKFIELKFINPIKVRKVNFIEGFRENFLFSGQTSNNITKNLKTLILFYIKNLSVGTYKRTTKNLSGEFVVIQQTNQSLLFM